MRRLMLQVDKNQATVHWKPPEDDGGSQVLYYVMEKRDVTRKEWTKVYNIILFIRILEH